MYKKFTSLDYKKNFGMADDYKVDALLVYGTFAKYPYKQFESSLKKAYSDVKEEAHEDEFFTNLRSYVADDKRYWMTISYGGALLSEYVHLACLFGSKKSIHIGSCGGLKKGEKNMDIIIPTWSYAEESSAKAYLPDANNKYEADEKLSELLKVKLETSNNVVLRGPTVTYQAMLAETWEDVVKWSEEGYYGVEMEAATVFAVSKHFKVPAAAVLMIADNLIEEETVMDKGYRDNRKDRRSLSQSIFDAVLSEL